MATCDPDPRTIDAGVDWFLSHNASGSGMCSQHSWHSLGGDRGCPPAWSCPNANAVYDKVIASGRYWTDPRRGDLALWKYGENGHAARVYNEAGTQIATTNPSSGPSNGTGIEDIDYPAKWGATPSKRIFTDTYNGVKCFTSGEPSIGHGAVYLSKLVYGQEDSDSVRRLQMHLNGHPLQHGEELSISGNYLDQTDEEVRLCQAQHGFGSDAARQSSVGPKQAGHLFAGCDCVVTDDREPAVPPVTEPQPPEPPVTELPDAETISFPLGIEYHYSGKPGGTLTFGSDKKKLDVAEWAPKKAGLTFGMLYANIDGEGEIRSSLVRHPDDGTAFQTHYVKGGDNYLLTHVWFESGEAGRKLWYLVESMDGTTHTVGTRYVKFVTIPWEVVVAIAEIGAAYMTVARPVLRSVAQAAGWEWPDLLEQIKEAAAA